MRKIYTDSRQAYEEKRRLIAEGKTSMVVQMKDNKFAVVVLEPPEHMKPKK